MSSLECSFQNEIFRTLVILSCAALALFLVEAPRFPSSFFSAFEKLKWNWERISLTGVGWAILILAFSRPWKNWMCESGSGSPFTWLPTQLSIITYVDASRSKILTFQNLRLNKWHIPSMRIGWAWWSLFFVLLQLLLFPTGTLKASNCALCKYSSFWSWEQHSVEDSGIFYSWLQSREGTGTMKRPKKMFYSSSSSLFSYLWRMSCKGGNFKSW